MDTHDVGFGLSEDTLIDELACSLDGRRLVVAVDGQGLVALDSLSGARTTVAVAGPIASLTISADGARCAWVPVVGRPVVVDLDASDPAPTRLPLESPAARVVFHPDGAHVALATGQGDTPRVELRRVADGALVAAFTCDTPVHLLDISPDGRHLAWAEVGGAVRVARLDAEGGASVVCAGDRRAWSLGDGVVALRVAGGYAWLGEPGGALQRVDVAADRLDPDWLAADPDDVEARPVAVSPGGRLVARGLAGRVEVHLARDGAVVLRVEASDWGATPFLPGDGRLILVEPDGGRVTVVRDGALIDEVPRVVLAPVAVVSLAERAAVTGTAGLVGEARPIHRDLVAELREAPDLEDAEREELIAKAPALARVLAAAAALGRATAARRLVERARWPRDGQPLLPVVSGATSPVAAATEEDLAAWADAEASWWAGLRERTAAATEDAVERLRDQASFAGAHRSAAGRSAWTAGSLAAALVACDDGAASAAVLVVAVPALDPGTDLAPLAGLASDEDAATGDRAAAVLALRALGAGDRADAALAATDPETAESITDSSEWLGDRAHELAAACRSVEAG